MALRRLHVLPEKEQEHLRIQEVSGEEDDEDGGENQVEEVVQAGERCRRRRGSARSALECLVQLYPRFFRDRQQGNIKIWVRFVAIPSFFTSRDAFVSYFNRYVSIENRAQFLSSKPI